jgi:hypothetical protein
MAVKGGVSLLRVTPASGSGLGELKTPAIIIVMTPIVSMLIDTVATLTALEPVPGTTRDGGDGVAAFSPQ